MKLSQRLSTVIACACVLFASGCGKEPSPTAASALPNGTVPPSPAPAPSPAPVLMRYHVSGIVTNEANSPIANAEVAVDYNFGGFKRARTSTNAGGSYEIVFETDQASYERTVGIVGMIHASGTEYENYYMQTVPWGTADIVKNLRLRRIRTVNAGQSIVISIDPDSSLAYDGDDWSRLDWVWEKLHVRVADAGTLTVTARPDVGGIVPSLAVLCIYVTDNCRYDWAQPPKGNGTGSLIVKANSLGDVPVAVEN